MKNEGRLKRPVTQCFFNCPLKVVTVTLSIMYFLDTLHRLSIVYQSAAFCTLLWPTFCELIFIEQNIATAKKSGSVPKNRKIHRRKSAMSSSQNYKNRFLGAFDQIQIRKITPAVQHQLRLIYLYFNILCFQQREKAFWPFSTQIKSRKTLYFPCF